MNGHSKVTSQLVESGEYFERARAWYRAIYVAPISERTFFLIIAIFAGVIATAGFVAMALLMPITERPGVLLPTANIDETLPKLNTLKEKGKPVNEALINFFVSSYVRMREGYSPVDYEANYNFIRAQSDAPTFEKYVASYDRANPQSPAAILGQTGGRRVTIQSVTVNDPVTPEAPKVANVAFTTEIEGRDLPSRTNWTATLQFMYTDLVVAEAVDSQTGQKTQTTEDPQFKVVDYVLTKAP